MIKYIQRKNLNLQDTEKILQESVKLNHFSNRGPAKYKLERILENILEIENSKRVVALSSGTSALHALMFMFESEKGRKLRWATPSFTFPSAVVGGLKTRILDIDLSNYTIPLNEKTLKSYDGFIITNLFGTYPSNISEWVDRCQKNNKLLIFDNASSPMTKLDGKNFSNLGNASFGSLHHTKYLGFGEGGFAVVEKDHYDNLNNIAGFGFNGNSVERRHSNLSSNFKISDISAAAIIQHIQKYDLDKHLENQGKIINALADIPGVEPFNFREGVVYGNLPLLYKKPFDHLIYRSLGIESQKYYYPLRRHRNSVWVYRRIVNLPLHQDLTDYEIDMIISSIKETIS